jgi:hypothetical protein
VFVFDVLVFSVCKQGGFQAMPATPLFMQSKKHVGTDIGRRWESANRQRPPSSVVSHGAQVFLPVCTTNKTADIGARQNNTSPPSFLAKISHPEHLFCPHHPRQLSKTYQYKFLAFLT